MDQISLGLRSEIKGRRQPAVTGSREKVMAIDMKYNNELIRSKKELYLSYVSI